MKARSILILFFTCTRVLAQDLNFSQFYELPLLRNPALAGIYTGDFRATSAFRSQWGSVTVPYTSQAMSLEMKTGVSQVSDNYFSVGVQMTRDMAGDSKFGKTQVLPMIAFHKVMSAERDAYLTLAFMGGVVQQRFDPTQLRFDDEFQNGVYTPRSTSQIFTQTQLNYLDAAVGLSYASEFNNGIRYYIGGGLFHFTNPKVAFYQQDEIRLSRKYIANAGFSLPISDYQNFIVYMDYFQQGGFSQGQGGFLYRNQLWSEDEDRVVSLTGGAIFRWNDAIIPVLRLDYHKIGVGLSYDANFSKLRTASQFRGGLELTLSFKSYLNIRNSSLEKTKCPVGFD
jgi:type IX secretion system PorP/SprF family membrane protein